MDEKRKGKIINKARKDGLIVDQSHPGQVFVFNLFAGGIVVPADCEKIFDLLKIFRSHAKHDKVGYHKVLLEQYVVIENLSNRVVEWVSAKHPKPPEAVTLQEVLEENGFNMGEIFTES